jgi:hypothetical protein
VSRPFRMRGAVESARGPVGVPSRTRLRHRDAASVTPYARWSKASGMAERGVSSGFSGGGGARALARPPRVAPALPLALGCALPVWVWAPARSVGCGGGLGLRACRRCRRCSRGSGSRCGVQPHPHARGGARPWRVGRAGAGGEVGGGECDSGRGRLGEGSGPLDWSDSGA